MKFKSLLSGACACLFVQSPVFSQETNSNKEETEAEQCWSGVGASLEGGQCLKEVDLLGQLELETPENALFTLMGATPDTMLRPKVGDKLAISFLPDIANALGSEQYSIGVNVNPGLWIMPDYYSPVDFKATSSDWKGGSDRVEQFKNAAYWSRFNISFASAQTTGDGALKKHGLGVSYKYDAGSPLEVLRSGGYGDCIRKKLPILRDKETLRAQDIAERLLDEVISKSTPGSIFEHRSFNTANPELEIDYFVRNKDQKDTLEYLTKKRSVVPTIGRDLLENNAEFAALRAQEKKSAKFMKECAVEAAPWNREIRGIGAGIYHSEASSPKEVGGPVADESETGFGIWGAYARPAGTNGQFAFSAQLTENLIRERKQDQETVQETVDGWRVSGRYTHKLAEVKTDKNSTLVRGFIEASYASEKFGDIDDEFTQAGIGLEVPLSNGMYFQLTYGDTWGSDIKRDDYLMGQVKWSLSGAAAS